MGQKVCTAYSLYEYIQTYFANTVRSNKCASQKCLCLCVSCFFIEKKNQKLSSKRSDGNLFFSAGPTPRHGAVLVSVFVAACMGEKEQDRQTHTHTLRNTERGRQRETDSQTERGSVRRDKERGGWERCADRVGEEIEGVTFRGFAVIIWQNAGESHWVHSTGTRVRGRSTIGRVICKCHSGGVFC